MTLANTEPDYTLQAPDSPELSNIKQDIQTTGDRLLLTNLS